VGSTLPEMALDNGEIFGILVIKIVNPTTSCKLQLQGREQKKRG